MKKSGSEDTSLVATDTGNINDLGKLLEEVQEWELKNSEEIKNQRQYKFTDIKRERAKTIELALNRDGQLDLEILQSEINSCKEEFIKVRVPSDVDISSIVINTDPNNNTNCKRKERSKTMTEYVV